MTAETIGPEIETAGRRIGRRELRHRCRDAQHEETDEGPADGVDDRPAELQSVAKQLNGAGENGNDRKRDGEIREAAHLAVQLLRVAELLQVVQILTDEIVAGRRRSR
jgi:hypothetical protein